MTVPFNNILVEGDAILTNMILPSTAIVTTLNGNTSLDNTSTTAQLLTGSATGYSLTMPDATTLPQGHKYEIYNTTNTTIAIKYKDGSLLFTLSQGSTGYIYLQSNATSNGVWLAWQIISDPNIASGILNYKLTSSTPFTTNSVTDIAITSFSVTPQAGTYAIWYNSSISITVNNTILRSSIYKNGLLITDSTRPTQGVGSNFISNASIITTAQFNGTETCDVRVRSTSGNITINDRTLLLIRLGG